MSSRPSVNMTTYEKARFLEEASFEDIVPSSANGDVDDADGANKTANIRLKPKQLASQRHRWLHSPWLFFLDLCLIVVILRLWIGRPASSDSQLSGDITGFVPAFSQEVTIFRSHPEFVSNHTSIESLEKARQAWIDFLPRGQGYVSLSDADIHRFELPRPVEYKGKQSLGSSWMHGLHCLYLIMSEYDMLAMGMRQPGYNTWHMDHCLDYVRQLIICSGDMALAGGDIPQGSSFLDVPHVCKNYDEMHRYLEDARDNDEYQFGTHATHFVPP